MITGVWCHIYMYICIYVYMYIKQLSVLTMVDSQSVVRFYVLKGLKILGNC